MMDDKLILNTLAADFTQSISRRLILWAVRWIIGFGIIALAAYFQPEWSWLWWVGGSIAALSLAITLTMHFVMQRKFAEVRRKMEEAERLAAEIGDEACDGSEQV